MCCFNFIGKKKNHRNLNLTRMIFNIDDFEHFHKMRWNGVIRIAGHLVKRKSTNIPFTLKLLINNFITFLSSWQHLDISKISHFQNPTIL